MAAVAVEAAAQNHYGCAHGHRSSGQQPGAADCSHMTRLSEDACWALGQAQKSCYTTFVYRWVPFAWASEALVDSHTSAVASSDELTFRRLSGGSKACAHLLGKMTDGLVRQGQGY